MNIPQITREKLASSVVGTPGVDTSGQQIGQEIAKAGEEIATPLWEAAKKQQLYKDSAEANLLTAQHKLDVQNLFEQYKVKYANNPEEASKSFWPDIQSLQDQNISSASNPRVKQLASQRDPLFDSRITSDLITWQYQQRDKIVTDNVLDKANQIAQGAYEQASNNSLDYATQQHNLVTAFNIAGNVAAAYDTAHPENNGKLTKQIKEALYKNTIDGYIDANPARALQFLNEEHTKEFIPGHLIEKMKNDAATHLNGMQKREELENLANTIVAYPEKIAGIDKGDVTFGSLTRDDPDDKLPYSKDLKNYALKTQFESQVEDAAMVLGLHDKAYQLGLEARGVAGNEKKDKQTPTESLQDLVNFQREILRVKPYMSKDAFNQFQKEVNGPLAANLAHMHTPGVMEQIKGNAGNWWNTLPWGDKNKAAYKVDSYAAGYNEITSILKNQGKNDSPEFKLAALQKFMDRSRELESTPNARDPNGRPYRPETIAREVLGQPVGSTINITKNGMTFSLKIKDYSAPGNPVLDDSDLPDAQKNFLRAK